MNIVQASLPVWTIWFYLILSWRFVSALTWRTLDTSQKKTILWVPSWLHRQCWRSIPKLRYLWEAKTLSKMIVADLPKSFSTLLLIKQLQSRKCAPEDFWRVSSWFLAIRYEKPASFIVSGSSEGGWRSTGRTTRDRHTIMIFLNTVSVVFYNLNFDELFEHLWEWEEREEKEEAQEIR